MVGNRGLGPDIVYVPRQWQRSRATTQNGLHEGWLEGLPSLPISRQLDPIAVADRESRTAPAAVCTGASHLRWPRNRWSWCSRTGGPPATIAWQKRRARIHQALRLWTARVIHLAGTRWHRLLACPAQLHQVVARASSQARTPAARHKSLAALRCESASNLRGTRSSGRCPSIRSPTQRQRREGRGGESKSRRSGWSKGEENKEEEK